MPICMDSHGFTFERVATHSQVLSIELPPIRTFCRVHVAASDASVSFPHIKYVFSAMTSVGNNNNNDSQSSQSSTYGGAHAFEAWASMRNATDVTIPSSRPVSARRRSDKKKPESDTDKNREEDERRDDADEGDEDYDYEGDYDLPSGLEDDEPDVHDERALLDQWRVFEQEWCETKFAYPTVEAAATFVRDHLIDKDLRDRLDRALKLETESSRVMRVSKRTSPPVAAAGSAGAATRPHLVDRLHPFAVHANRPNADDKTPSERKDEDKAPSEGVVVGLLGAYHPNYRVRLLPSNCSAYHPVVATFLEVEQFQLAIVLDPALVHGPRPHSVLPSSGPLPFHWTAYASIGSFRIAPDVDPTAASSLSLMAAPPSEAATEATKTTQPAPSNAADVCHDKCGILYVPPSSSLAWRRTPTCEVTYSGKGGPEGRMQRAAHLLFGRFDLLETDNESLTDDLQRLLGSRDAMLAERDHGRETKKEASSSAPDPISRFAVAFEQLAEADAQSQLDARVAVEWPAHWPAPNGWFIVPKRKAETEDNKSLPAAAAEKPGKKQKKGKLASNSKGKAGGDKAGEKAGGDPKGAAVEASKASTSLVSHRAFNVQLKSLKAMRAACAKAVKDGGDAVQADTLERKQKIAAKHFWKLWAECTTAREPKDREAEHGEREDAKANKSKDDEEEEEEEEEEDVPDIIVWPFMSGVDLKTLVACFSTKQIMTHVVGEIEQGHDRWHALVEAWPLPHGKSAARQAAARDKFCDDLAHLRVCRRGHV